MSARIFWAFLITTAATLSANTLIMFGYLWLLALVALGGEDSDRASGSA